MSDPEFKTVEFPLVNPGAKPLDHKTFVDEFMRLQTMFCCPCCGGAGPSCSDEDRASGKCCVKSFEARLNASIDARAERFVWAGKAPRADPA